MTASIHSERLDLIPMTPAFLRASLDCNVREAEQLLQLSLPAEWPEGHTDVLSLRLKQLEDDPALQPWLLRAMALRTTGVMVGTIGFHAAPGADYLQQFESASASPLSPQRGEGRGEGWLAQKSEEQKTTNAGGPPVPGADTLSMLTPHPQSLSPLRGEGSTPPLSPGAVEFGFTVFPAFRRQGYAREASLALIRWARQTHGVTRFILSIRPDNTASQALAAQLGFVRIGSHIDEVDGLEDVLERKPCR